ncbi:MAG: tryptophan synthase subunit alpha [bacterium]|nr:tryptophan synthase subunit alpha [bacterium]
MEPLQELFKNKKVLNCYITAGYPDLRTFKEILMTLSRNDVDIIEIGIPFSDPIADGDVIQKATIKVLDDKINIETIAEILKGMKNRIKSRLLFMSYFNPIFVYGEDKFIRLAKSCGVSGVIVPDLPYDEGQKFYEKCINNGLETVLLVTSVTPLLRIKEIAKFTTGFLYFVSVLGTTGIRNSIPLDIINNLKLIKQNIQLPLCLGFGIRSGRGIRPFLHHIDGIIVGSALISLINRYQKNKKLLMKKIIDFVRELSKALNG